MKQIPGRKPVQILTSFIICKACLHAMFPLVLIRRKMYSHLLKMLKANAELSCLFLILPSFNFLIPAVCHQFFISTVSASNEGRTCGVAQQTS